MQIKTNECLEKTWASNERKAKGSNFKQSVKNKAFNKFNVN